MFLIDWFNDNDGFTMALLTAVYVIATLWIVSESRRTNRLQKRLLEQSEVLERSRKRPYVVFSIDFERIQKRYDSHTYVYARIRNTGATSAHDVVVTVSPDLKGRLGIDGGVHRPAIVGSTVSFMPPNYEIKDLVSYAQFLFEDHKDEELRFQITINYRDDRGEHYQERYLIDVAAQKEASDLQDETALTALQLVEQVGRMAKSLDDIARTLDSPDRSLFAGSSIANDNLSPEQQALLSRLTVASGGSKSQLFFASRCFGDEQATIRQVRGNGSGPGEKEIKGYIEDIEYLCRVGALHGHYTHGHLQFSLTPGASLMVSQINTPALPQTI